MAGKGNSELVQGFYVHFQAGDVRLAGLPGGLDAQSNVPGDDDLVTLNDEFLKVE